MKYISSRLMYFKSECKEGLLECIKCICTIYGKNVDERIFLDELKGCIKWCES